MEPTPQRLTGTTNELVKERNRAAAERTLTAWIQNCITLVGFGFAFDQITRALNRTIDDAELFITETAAEILAIVFIGFGIGLLVIALVQYRLAVQSIEDENYLLKSITAMNRIVLTTILIFGLLSAVVIVIVG